MWGWDPVARQYVDTWVDIHDGAVRTDYGFWNPEDHTMYWNALQPDGSGHMVGVRMTEKYETNRRTPGVLWGRLAIRPRLQAGRDGVHKADRSQEVGIRRAEGYG